MVSRMGLGCMGMSDVYGPADRGESLATLAMAVERRITLLDTGDFYAMGHNEMLIGEALETLDRDNLTLSVKFGGMRGPDGQFYGFDGRPAAVKNFAAYSLKRLGVEGDRCVPPRADRSGCADRGYGRRDCRTDRGGLCAPHRPVRNGRRNPPRHAVHPIADLQIEYSLISRGIEEEILPVCELGIAVTAYGVLARGLIGGHWRPEAAAPNDHRAHTPRFQGDNLERNLTLVEALRGVAQARGLSVAQAAFAWVLARGADIVPLAGVRRRDRLEEALGSLDAALSDADLAAIEAAMPESAAAGSRYPKRRWPISIAKAAEKRPERVKRCMYSQPARPASSVRQSSGN